ncbi:MAG: FKBP-type peptidyl-prolyl cis-trans isomerase [Zetaproteobacteria bacterium]|nr:MAG: FKBP-type peptidyl-prolyl cis-trans isomerase [Zetaproteobacteria bacterium]
MRWMLAIVMVALPLLAQAQDAPTLKTEKDKLSYAMGMDLGAQLKARTVDIDPAIFARGLRDALTGGKTVLTEDEAKTIIAALQKAQVAKQAALAKTVGDKNKAEGDAFLAANKAKPGVATLPSGLQYKILTPGTGKKPTAADTVVCHYRGTLIDGKEFDSSYKRGEPASFPVNKVIKGWTEVLQLMPVGSKWQVFIPSNLGYAERGAGADIGPFATLIFEIELIAIK